MVRRTFFGARRVGLIASLTLLVSGCASILGNDFEVEDDAAVVGAGASGSTSTSSTGGAAGTGGSRGASGSAGSLTGGSSGAGGSVVTGGASGAGGANAAGASGGPGTGGGAGLDPDAGDSNVMPPDSSVADAGTTDAPSDQSQGVDAASDQPIGSDSRDGSIDAVSDAPVCNPINGSCGGGGLTCNPGFSTCNGSVTDGCECPTPGCCGASCQVQHVACMLNGNPATPCTDGTGNYFYDCVSQGTINGAQATKACTAGTGASSCTNYTCTGNAQVVCGFDGVGNCVCWEFFGTNAGRVFRSSTLTCFCPGSADPRWN